MYIHIHVHYVYNTKERSNKFVRENSVYRRIHRGVNNANICKYFKR